jgi:hypothetical protein
MRSRRRSENAVCNLASIPHTPLASLQPLLASPAWCVQIQSSNVCDPSRAVESLIAAAVKEGNPGSVEKALEIAQAEAKKLLAEDMTGTLKPFTKAQLHGIAKKAMKDEL